MRGHPQYGKSMEQLPPVQASLRDADGLSHAPGVETPGYYLWSLRDLVAGRRSLLRQSAWAIAGAPPQVFGV